MNNLGDNSDHTAVPSVKKNTLNHAHIMKINSQ